MDLLEKLMPKVGDRVGGRYRLESVLGEGGFGVVYVARQESLDRQVAIKMLLPAALSDRTAVARFQREVDMVRRLEHPNTVRIFDRGETEQGLQFYAMELVKGRTLSQVLADEGPLKPARVKRITEQVLMSLGEAHAHGIVHRDLKPGNIMLTEVFGQKDFVKVLDFGIGKVMEGADGGVGLTTQGLIGTPFYMSPEQAKAQADLDGRSDLYALGLIMHEVLTRRRAVDGPSPLEVIMVHVRPDPVDIDPAVMGGPLGEIIARATVKNRDARYASAEEMLTALKAVSIPEDAPAYPAAGLLYPGGAGTPRTPGSVPIPVTPLQARAETMLAPETPVAADGRAKSRVHRGALAVVVLLFVAVAAGIFLIVRGGTGGHGVGVGSGSTDAGGIAVESDAGTFGGSDARVAVIGGDEADAGGPGPTAADVGVRLTDTTLTRVGESAQVLRRRRAAIAQATGRSAEVVGEAYATGVARAEEAVVPVGDEPDAGTGPDAVGIAEPDAEIESEEEDAIAAAGADAEEEPEGVTVTIRGSPSRARVRIAGETVCRRLPCEVVLPAGSDSVRARISARGHVTETIRLSPDPGRVYEVDLWETFD